MRSAFPFKIAFKGDCAPNEATYFDPASLKDHVADSCAWTPMKRGGISIRTHSLVQVNQDQLAFVLSLTASLLFLLLAVLGFSALAYVLLGPNKLKLDPGTVNDLVLGAVFFIAGLWLYYKYARPIVLDKKKNLFWSSWSTPANDKVKLDPACMARLDEVHAVQILAERCGEDGQEFYSYEINLVLEDGRRVHIIDHGNIDKIEANAKTIGAFLQRPVWNASA